VERLAEPLIIAVTSFGTTLAGLLWSLRWRLRAAARRRILWTEAQRAIWRVKFAQEAVAAYQQKNGSEF
jgi:hypothetical protein